LDFHGRFTIGMDGELAGRDVLRAATVMDESLGQLGTFAVSDHPPDHVAAKNIQNDVEMVDGPFHRAAQFGDVPAPQLVGLRGQQLRLLIRRDGSADRGVRGFRSAFPASGTCCESMKPAFIEQRCVDLRGRAVLKTLLMKTRQHVGLFLF
jgi:hypothetical protein